MDSKSYPVIVGDESIDSARKAIEVLTDIKNKIIFGGNYFTDFLPPSRCWLIWDKENSGNCFADAELAWTSFDKNVKLYHWLWNGLSRKGERVEELKTRVHPTQKPVGLFKQILQDYSDEGAIIIDPFLGSGTTLIACEKTGRNCRGIEISPDYCAVILQRYLDATGKTPVLVT
ncbi:MAG: site-specific DNA-methyltransferase [Methanobacteriota archaeon]